MAKTFCYSDECEIIETGFRLEVYYVCKKCKMEVNKDFKERNEYHREQKRLREERKAKEQEEEKTTIFEFLDFPYD